MKFTDIASLSQVLRYTLCSELITLTFPILGLLLELQSVIFNQSLFFIPDDGSLLQWACSVRSLVLF